jgi:hypothetical protein
MRSIIIELNFMPSDIIKNSLCKKVGLPDEDFRYNTGL